MENNKSDAWHKIVQNKAQKLFNGTRLESITCATILALPILANIYWITTSASLPSDDAACYLQVAYEHYKSFFTTPLTTWLRDVYMIRGWTQILFPFFALPLLFIFGGNALMAITVLAATAYALLVYFTYKLSNLYVGRIQAAFAAVVATTMSTYFLRYTLILHFSESLWLLFSVITFYYIIKSQYFNKRKETIICAIFFALTVNIRPIETITICVIPIGITLLAHLKHSDENKAYLGWALSYSLVSLVVLAIFAFVRAPGYIVLGLAFVSISLCYALRHKILPGKVTNVELFSLISCAAILLWWSPKMPELFFYSYQCTFGQAAALTDNHPGLTGKIHILQTLADNYNYKLFAALVALASASIIIGCKDKYNPDYNILFGIASGMLVPMILMLLVTETATPRRCYVAVFFLVIFLAVYSMRKGKFSFLGTIAVIGICIMQLQPLYPYVLGAKGPSWSVSGSFSMQQRAKSKSSFAPNFEILNKLNELNIPKNSAIAVYSNSTYSPHLRCYEIWSMLLAKSITSSQYDFQHLRTYTFNELASSNPKPYTHLLLDSVGSAGAKQVIPFSNTVQSLVQIATSGELLPQHTLVASFEMCGRQHYLYEVDAIKNPGNGQGLDKLRALGVDAGAVYSTTAHNYSGADWDKGIYTKDGYHTFYFIIKQTDEIPVKLNDEVLIAAAQGKVTKVTTCPTGSDLVSVFVTTTLKISPKTGGYPNSIIIYRR